MKIYWRTEEIAKYYVFKIFICGILVISSIDSKKVRKGNKRKSNYLRLAFWKSRINESTSISYKHPDLNSWNEYLESFKVSDDYFMRWVEKRILGPYRWWMLELKRKLENR